MSIACATWLFYQRLICDYGGDKSKRRGRIKNQEIKHLEIQCFCKKTFNILNIWEMNGKMYTWLHFPRKMKTGMSRSWPFEFKTPFKRGDSGSRKTKLLPETASVSGGDWMWIWVVTGMRCRVRAPLWEMPQFRMGLGLPGKVSQHVSHDADPPSSSSGCDEADSDPGAESCSYLFLYLCH